jgi:hypothetical protein
MGLLQGWLYLFEGGKAWGAETRFNLDVYRKYSGILMALFTVLFNDAVHYLRT